MSDKDLQPRQLVLTCAGRAAMVVRVDEQGHEAVLRRLDTGDVLSHLVATLHPLAGGPLFVAPALPNLVPPMEPSAANEPAFAATEEPQA